MAAHAAVSYSIPAESAGPQAGGDEGAAGDEAGADEGFSVNLGPFGFSFEAGEEAGAETQYEAVEGWEESDQEAAEEADQEAVVDAWYGQASEAEQQEFLQVFAPLLPILAKTVVPAIASAAAKNLPGAVSGILQRLGRRRRAAGGRRETGEEAALDEAALEAASQQLEVIIDRDDRTQVKNTTVVPWKRICHLDITAANGKKFLGTGALVAPRTVVTAGHCVHMSRQGGWVRSITVTPGRNAASKPFGSCKAVGLRSVRGWVHNGLRDYDYGAIILPTSCKIPGVSAFGFASLSDSELLSRKLNTAGYPGDKPVGTMWYAGRKAKSVTPRTIVYNTATMGGQSGSPVWLRRADGTRLMVGIHTNGSMSGNSATRITAPVLANLKKWRQQGMGGHAAAVGGSSGGAKKSPGITATVSGE